MHRRDIGQGVLRSALSLLEQGVLPVAVGYLLVMLFLWAGLRRLLRAPRAANPPAATEAPAGGARRRVTGRGLLRHLLSTLAGGCTVLALAMVGYYHGVAGNGPRFFAGMFGDMSLLLALAAPVYVGYFTVSRLLRRRRGRPPQRTGDASGAPVAGCAAACRVAAVPGGCRAPAGETAECPTAAAGQRVAE